VIVSVVIRAKDEAPSIGRVLELLREQELGEDELETIVVDSGSGDGTGDIARSSGARVVEIRADSFTFGGALNTGCAEARGEIVVALSAHAFPRDPGWLGRLVACFEDPRVACASGELYAAAGGPLTERVVQDAELLRRHVDWGYSNAAGAFRAELWRQHPFRADLPGTEDKAWAHHWIERGYVCLIDPDLLVDHDHSKDSVGDQYVRSRREWQGRAMYLGLPARGAWEVAREWWSDQASYRSRLRSRLSHRRAARLLGMYAGLRRAQR
jgi:rhamnosyltransferase